MLNAAVYRARVTYSDASTGQIKIQVPTLGGADSTIDISFIGRTAYNGVWPVPSIGSQIVVTADDANLTNVFWLQVTPDPATSLVGLQEQIDTISSDLSYVSSNLATTTGVSASNRLKITSVENSVTTTSSDITSLTSRTTELESFKDASFLGIFR
jgi:hypothetical protein